MEDFQSWIVIAEKIGIPTFILMSFAIASYKVIIWLGENILIPVTTKHIEFLDNIEKSLKAADKFSQDLMTLQKSTFKQIDNISETQENIEKCLKAITQCEEKIISYVQVIQERMTKE
jgi:hypothetical protein